jgi:hypothetical protein
MSARHGTWVAFWFAATTALCLASSPVDAQDVPRTCQVTQLTDPPGDLLTCRDGLVIRTERSSVYRLIERRGDRAPESAELTGRGLLIELPPGQGRRRFQINTPHVIASVRGTIWAVDVTALRTSVFVQRGFVEVRRPASRAPVSLGPGEGVDVESTGALEVKRWPVQRATALMARFGR